MVNTVRAGSSTQHPTAGEGGKHRRLFRVTTHPRFRRAVAFVLPFVLWEVLARLADNRLLPTPGEVVATLWTMTAEGTIRFHGTLTLQRGLIGLSLAIVAGVTFGILLARVRWFEATFQPLLAATYPVPKLALYPVFILLFGFGGASKIAMVALECFYPIAYNTYGGVQNVGRNYIWVAHNVGAGRLQRVQILLRAASPSIMASFRMAVPIMLTIMVVTELLGESRGLGFLIRRSGSSFQPSEGLAVILLLAIAGYVFDRSLSALNRTVSFWAKGVSL